MTQEKFVLPIQLWPPLALIRSRFESAPDDPAEDGAAVVTPPAACQTALDPVGELPGPLEDLARLRAALAQRAFDARWVPGRLIGLCHLGQMLGVLLDKREDLGHRPYWRGWLASSEADWAGAFDVLLEPMDEPFDPAFGMVQVWNPVTIAKSPRWNARVFGELSAARLAAIRAVQDEWLAQTTIDIEPAPGIVALREVADTFSVLTGTPLASENDERIEYQALYRTVAQQLSAVVTDEADQSMRAGTGEHDGERFATRVLRWFGADKLIRPAFALLALVMIGQTALMIATPSPEDVRFRGVATGALTAPGADRTLLLFWKNGVSVEESTLLLRSLSAEVVAGPDARGAYTLRVADPASTRARLAASSLVESVAMPPP
jgi:hypothetical protein